MNASLLIVLVIVPQAWSFGPAALVGTKSAPTRYTYRTSLSAILPDNNGDNGNNSDTDKDSSLYASLYNRQEQLQTEHKRLRNNWKKGECKSEVKVVLPEDWVRRIQVDYPLAACGSASGSLYVAHLETGEILATTAGDEQPEAVHSAKSNEQLQHALKVLYGQFDGGGTIAIAFGNHGLLVDSSRNGVNIHQLDQDKQNLISQGSLVHFGSERTATVLRIDEDYLWVGASDGTLQAYSLEESDDDRSDSSDENASTIAQPLALRRPKLEWKLEEAITSLSLVQSQSVGVVSTASGLVHIISYAAADYTQTLQNKDTNKTSSKEQSQRPISTLYPPWESSGRSSTNTYATSAMLVPQKQIESPHYTLVCAGNEGSMFVQPVEIIEDSKGRTEIRFTRPLRPLRPSHFAAVPCLSSPAPGMFVSSGRDGRMRIWNLENNEGDGNDDNDDKKDTSTPLPHVYTGDSFTQDDFYNCVVQLNGYKVWIGSLYTDEKRIVSDGTDNTIVVHTFE